MHEAGHRRRGDAVQRLWLGLADGSQFALSFRAGSVSADLRMLHGAESPGLVRLLVSAGGQQGVLRCRRGPRANPCASTSRSRVRAPRWRVQAQGALAPRSAAVFSSLTSPQRNSERPSQGGARRGLHRRRSDAPNFASPRPADQRRAPLRPRDRHPGPSGRPSRPPTSGGLHCGSRPARGSSSRGHFGQADRRGLHSG